MYCNIFKLLDDASFSNEIASTCILQLHLHRNVELHSSYHLFLTLRIPHLGKLCRRKVMQFRTSNENFPQQNFQKSQIYQKVLVKFRLELKIFPKELFPNKVAFQLEEELNCQATIVVLFLMNTHHHSNIQSWSFKNTFMPPKE